MGLACGKLRIAARAQLKAIFAAQGIERRGCMSQASAWSLREVWTRKLIYPGHSLPTAIASVLVAMGLAHHDGVFAAGPAALAFLAGWLIQFGGLVTDNYENLRREPDDREHPELVQAVASGLLSLRALRATIVATYGLAVIAGFALLAMAGWPVIVIGLASILASWAYSAGPWPVGRHGFADPLFFLFFGTMSVIGTYYVQAAVVLGPQHWRAALPFAAVAVSLPIGALITNILIIDDIRDRDFDVVKGKNTIAVRFGKSWSRAEFLCLLAFAYLAPFWLWLSLGFSAFVLLPLLTLPLAALVTHAVWTRERFDELVPMTPRMAMLTVAFSLCLSVGLVAG
jgi:1,4-dihydroxy-2-naphthoate octaprenyltransferase